MTLLRITFTLIGISLLAGAQEQTIRIDGRAAGKPFPHVWEQMFGSGRAVLSLRQSYRDDLRATKRATDLQYVRFHAIFHDEMGVYDEDAQGHPVYNWSYVDQSYDGLLAEGVKPFVELSFMPRKLAANAAPHPFWYKPLPSPPHDPAKWSALVSAFARHLIHRYGRSEVESWYFEVWNEPNIDFWSGEPKEATYYQLYDETARTLKQVDERLRVGGPATAQAAWVDRFLAHCIAQHVPFDFVSTHIYGNEDPVLVFGRKLPIQRQEMVARAAEKVHQQVQASAAPNTPIIWSEYNATYLNQIAVTDSAFMGPWLANNIRLCDGLATLTSLWTFSDVFEEQGVVRSPFYGGYGLIAAGGIPKAAFRAMELLHRLGNERLPSESSDVLVTRRADGKLVIAAWNYAEPEETGSDKVFRFARMDHPQGSPYVAQILNDESGSAVTEWQRMGRPSYPTQAQREQLIHASQLAPAQEHAAGDPLRLRPRSLAVLEMQ